MLPADNGGPGAWRGVVACVLLAGCAQVSLDEVPIIDRSAPYGAAPAAVQPPAGNPGSDDFYTVQKGDTLYHIATAYHVGTADLARWNGIGETTPIAIGQRLRVRAPAASAGASAGAPPSAQDATAAAPGAEASVVPIATSENVQVHPLSAVPSNDAAAPAAAASAAPGPAGTPGGPGAAAGWIWPVDGRVVVNFDPVHGQGVDIAVSEDAPVVAVADGEVTYTGSPRDYGNLITIRHAGDMLSVYAHDKSILVKQGDMVKRGQAIATAGKTSSAAAFLHFEARQRGVPVDPLGYLPVR